MLVLALLIPVYDGSVTARFFNSIVFVTMNESCTRLINCYDMCYVYSDSLSSCVLIAYFDIIL